MKLVEDRLAQIEEQWIRVRILRLPEAINDIGNLLRCELVSLADDDTLEDAEEDDTTVL